MLGMFFIYSLKVALCLITFYLLYKTLLSYEKLHTFNRIVLLSIIILAIFIPCIKVAISDNNVMNQGMLVLEDIIVSVETSAENKTQSLTLLQTLFLIYIVGVLFFIIREVVSIHHLCLMIKRSEIVERRNGMSIITLDEKISPFSWFRYIVMSKTDYAENSYEIVVHEMAHSRLYHSVDVLLCNLLIIFQWYNPAAWLLKRELQDIHEYEADDAVLRDGVDAKQYQLLLIKKAVGEQMFSMANNLNHNSLKKRIKMMKKQESSKWSCAKVLALIPATAIAIIAFGNPSIQATANNIVAESNNIVNAITKKTIMNNSDSNVMTELKPTVTEHVVPNAKDVNQTDDKKEKSVVVMPTFVGGQDALTKYMIENIKYPENAKKDNISGQVLVQFTVEEDGSVTGAEVVKKIHPDLDAEALRVVSNMPKWNSGSQDGKTVKVKFTIPVNFATTGALSGKINSIKISGNQKTKNIQSDIHEPYIVINGEPSTKSILDALAPEKIKSMSILKGEKAVEKYGEKGNKGVIEIVTK